MIRLVVNGSPGEVQAGAGATLLQVLRGKLGLTGPKPACGEGECGACTVLVDGAPVFSCRTPIEEVDGRSVTTVEGLAQEGRRHPVQDSLLAARAFQCGYCAPGMVVRAAALLSRTPSPDSAAVVAAMNPNLCRCGCYSRIAKAIRCAGEAPRGAPEARASASAPDVFHAGAAPLRPWDLCAPGERDWFDVLGDGLVVVWPPPQETSGRWSTAAGAWVHVGPSGAVTGFSGKVDLGQDNRTAFGLLVAEELAVSLDGVQMVLGDTDVCPYDAGTFGSRSMPDSGEALRRAAAGAREVLVGLAARWWGVARENLRAGQGAVAGGPGDATLSYGELVAGMRLLEVLGADPPLSPPSRWQVAGREPSSLRRADHVTGSRRFVSDLDRPGLLHGAILRPPWPGARLLDLDDGPARAVPGVTLVSDGELVGAVAPDPADARRAVSSLRAQWDEPPEPPGDLVGHLRSHPSPADGWERPIEEVAGDPAAALETAAVRIQATYTTAYIAHTPLETRAALAEWEGDRLSVWTSTQVPFGVRRQLASAFGIDEAKVRVVVPATGGGFGGKHHGEVAEEAARLARATARAVKVHWTRSEEFQWGYLRPMAVIDVLSGLDGAGSVVAWDFTTVNAGPAGLACPYAIPSKRLRYQPAESPVAQGSYRALGATANHFARESHIDELAHAARADPVDFRLRQLEDDRLARVVSAAAERFGWPGTGHGCGVAAGREKGGRVATCAEVAVEDGGRVVLKRVLTAYDCGAVVNPDTVRSQIEGATVMALGGALFESARIEQGRMAEPTLCSYRVPRFADVPDTEVLLLDRPEFRSAGAGETPMVALAPAVSNAVFAATGRRLRSLPLLAGDSLP